MTRTILVAGTASHVGKSTVAAGLCRLLADRGLSVAPFKAQNMSNNARVVPTRDGDYGEVGVSQYVQARAADVAPTTDVNPVLLKPRGEGESQLIVNGEAVTHVGSGEYYAEHWHDALAAAEAAHDRLATEHDVVVAEGAGSAGEPNLRDRDLANVETARFADARVLLVADIERGGAFASVVGTLELAPEALAERVAGVLVTKFRGDLELLAPAIDELETRTSVPVLGVLPHDDPGLPAEDSVSLPPAGERAVRGVDDVERTATVAVPRLHRLSNFTDLEPLAREPGIRVAYVPPDAPLDADAVVLPGTKNTVDDLLALRAAGFDEALASFDGPVVGVCGGYQMLGERIHNAEIERAGDDDVDDPAEAETARDGDTVRGFGLLPVETTFSEEKRVARVTRTVDGVGPLAGAGGEATGYEIHMGETDVRAPVARPVGPDSAAVGDVLGTYLHGLFENEVVRRAFFGAVFEAAGHDSQRSAVGSSDSADVGDVDADVPSHAAAHNPYDAAAELLREYADLEPLLSPAVVR